VRDLRGEPAAGGSAAGAQQGAAGTLRQDPCSGGGAISLCGDTQDKGAAQADTWPGPNLRRVGPRVQVLLHPHVPQPV